MMCVHGKKTQYMNLSEATDCFKTGSKSLYA